MCPSASVKDPEHERGGNPGRISAAAVFDPPAAVEALTTCDIMSLELGTRDLLDLSFCLFVCFVPEVVTFFSWCTVCGSSRLFRLSVPF